MGLGKVLVTGASSGIGKAIALRLLDEGYEVVGLARQFAGVPCREGLTPVTLDLADLGRLPQALQALRQTHADVDVLVCNAGQGRFGCLEEFSYAQIREGLELNFLSHAYVARAFLPAMKQRGRGDLIFMGSEAALAGGRRGAVYAAAKFALRGFAQSLRHECASSGVRVGIINPGMVKTRFFEGLGFGPGEDESNYLLPEDVAAAVALMLATRRGSVLDEINLSPLKRVVRSSRER